MIDHTTRYNPQPPYPQVSHRFAIHGRYPHAAPRASQVVIHNRNRTRGCEGTRHRCVGVVEDAVSARGTVCGGADVGVCDETQNQTGASTLQDRQLDG